MKSTNHWGGGAIRVKYFWNKMADQIKNSNDIKILKIEFDGFR